MAYNADGSTTVTDPLGTARTLNFTTVLGVVKSTGQSQPGGAGCAAASSARTYDANGNTASADDFDGHRSCYAYDLTRNLETARVEGLSSTTACPAPLASYVPAAGTEQRRIQTQWHPDWRLEVLRAEPKKLTTWVYNGQPDPSAGGAIASCAPSTALLPTGKPIAVLCKQIEQATTDPTGAAGFGATATGSPRVSTWTYNALGQVLTATGPRGNLPSTDPDYAPATTTYAYYASTDPSGNWTMGDLASVTDALGHVTQITQYDKNGRPLAVIDPNSVTTTLTYYPRGWLKSVSITGGTPSTTSYLYDNAGQLTQVTLPDASTIGYGYDPAHRLLSITDTLGNQLVYTLDNLGNHKTETWKNPNGTPAQVRNRDFDVLGRLWHAIGASNQTTTYGYDPQGNLQTRTDAKLNPPTTLGYDALNRLKQITDAQNGLTQIGHDGLDQISSVTAANGAATQYSVDGLGNLNQETSADHGITTATYDVAGNLKTRSDARGITASYHYDALDRVTTVTYPSSGENVTYVWDAASGCSYGIGRLCQINDASGSVTFAYDSHGNRVKETRVEDGQTSVTQYVPDLADRPQDTILPTGETLSLQRDVAGRIQQVSSTSVAGTSVVARGIAYNAAGQVTVQTLGTNTPLSTQYTLDGQAQGVVNLNTVPDADVPLPAWALALLGSALASMVVRRGRATVALAIIALSLSLSSLPGATYADDLSFSYDPNGNVQSKTTPLGTTTFGYDPLDRLHTESGVTGARTHGYDANGNRLDNGAGTTASYTANSDRLATINGVSVTLDAAGNLTADGTYRYVWSQAGQLAEVHKADNTLLATYTYDYRGLRKKKQTTVAAPQGATTTYYHYDPQGHLLAETGVGGTPLKTYLWRDDTLTGLVVHQPTRTVYAVETDPLGSPFQVLTLSGQVVWRWVSEGYGNTLPNEDVQGTGTKLTLNLRFPGQYFDLESGLFYNWNRYYSPRLGRYLSSDPIGLAGGPNPFAYAKQNPLYYIDPLGLDVTVYGYYTEVGGAGHIGLGVNGDQSWGFYPKNQNAQSKILQGLGVDQPGAIKPDDMTQPYRSITIKTTPAQDKAIQQYIYGRWKKPGNYNLYSRQCSGFVKNALNAGGVFVPDDSKNWIPNVLFKDLSGSPIK